MTGRQPLPTMRVAGAPAVGVRARRPVALGGFGARSRSGVRLHTAPIALRTPPIGRRTAPFALRTANRATHERKSIRWFGSLTIERQKLFFA